MKTIRAANERLKLAIASIRILGSSTEAKQELYDSLTFRRQAKADKAKEDREFHSFMAKQRVALA
jgi:hypothetical protein